MRSGYFLLFGILISIILSLTSSVVLAETNIFASTKPLGIPLEKWAQQYWQWWATIPLNVLDDAQENNDKCIIGSDSSKRVFFLADSYSNVLNLKCNVPSTVGFLIPLLIGECDPTVEDLRKNPKLIDFWNCASNADEPLGAANIKLDGKLLFEMVNDRATNSTLLKDALVRNSSLFNITIPLGSQFNVTAGTYPAVVDGRYLFLKPLPPGEHTLQYHIEHGRPDITGATVVPGDTQYTLIVK
jgi:hypothetical protein